MSKFIGIADLAAAKAAGADIYARTFIDRPDLPPAWFDQFRAWGFQPVAPTPTPADLKAQASEEAERAALDAQVEAMSQAEYRELREMGWTPGEPTPGTTPAKPD